MSLITSQCHSCRTIAALMAGAAEECQSPTTALRRAEMMSRMAGSIGAVAFSRSGDPMIGEFGDAQLLRKFGNVPDDLSGSCRAMPREQREDVCATESRDEGGIADVGRDMDPRAPLLMRMIDGKKNRARRPTRASLRQFRAPHRWRRCSALRTYMALSAASSARPASEWVSRRVTPGGGAGGMVRPSNRR